jgi:hypothetical protein
LSGCALTCKSWAAIAAAATQQISISKKWRHRRTSTIDDWKVPAGLASWLKKHIVGVEQLGVCLTYNNAYGEYGFCPKPLQVPCAELQQLTSLSLKGINLQLTPAVQPQLQGTGASSSNMVILPNLVELKLVACCVGSVAELLQLVRASGLTSLHLDNVSWAAASREHENHTEACSATFAILPELEQCSSLVALHLDLSDRCINKEDLATAGPSPLTSISQLQHLHYLDVSFPYRTPYNFMPSVPSAITHLKLGYPSTKEQEPMVLQQIPQLDHLQSLHIKNIGVFDIGTLVNMTQLLCLRLEKVAVDAAVLGRMPHLQELVLQDCTTETPAASALAAIGQLTQLRVLEVVHFNKANNYASLLHDAPISAMSALTASSQLQRLHVNCMKYSSGSAVPDGAILHMFWPGHLQQLVYLRMGPEKALVEDRCRGSGTCTGIVHEEDLECIVSCCPSLQSLHLMYSLKAGDVIEALLQLRQCHSLSLGGAAHEFDNKAAAVIAQMTQLTHLSCVCNRGINSMGIQLLTGLTGLQQLQFIPVYEEYGSQSLDCVMEADLAAMLSEDDRHMSCSVVLNSKVGVCADCSSQLCVNWWHRPANVLPAVTCVSVRCRRLAPNGANPSRRSERLRLSACKPINRRCYQPGLHGARPGIPEGLPASRSTVGCRLSTTSLQQGRHPLSLTEVIHEYGLSALLCRPPPLCGVSWMICVTGAPWSPR